MIQSIPTMDNWDEAFSVLVEITEEGRQRDSSFAKEMYQLEESIEYQCDVSGWFEDYMDELEMCERYDRLQCLRKGPSIIPVEGGEPLRH